MGGRAEWMREALRLARDNVAAGGGPFAALVVRGGAVVATGVNRVVPDGDPTAHAEVVAIREACRRLGSFDLSGCELYASCEPCPMCAGAIGWARLARVHYAAARGEAAAAGFDDERLWADLARPPEARTPPAERLLADEGKGPFTAWLARADRRRY
ncbi:MAG: nucleoside deaminase [Deltaproteobacteria bacterium]|nr:nucleoside deaminase [Deltaproteobacteria bacterium]